MNEEPIFFEVTQDNEVVSVLLFKDKIIAKKMKIIGNEIVIKMNIIRALHSAGLTHKLGERK